MRTSFVVMSLLVASTALAQPTTRAATSSTSARSSDDPIAALVKGLLAGDKEANAKLAALKIDDSNVEAVKAQLQAPRGTPTQVAQVTNWLGQAVLARSTPEILAQIQPIVKANGGHLNYQELPKISGPEFTSPKPTDADLLKAMERVEKARDKRRQAEMVVIHHNEAVWNVGVLFVQMTLKMNDQKEDDALIKWMLDKEDQSSADWKLAAEAITKAAPTMPKDRAAHMYKALLVPADKLCWQVHPYVNHKEANLHASAEPSGFVVTGEWTAKTLRPLVNTLAKVAGEKELKVPQETPVNDYANVQNSKWTKFPAGFPTDVPPGIQAGTMPQWLIPRR